MNRGLSAVIVGLILLLAIPFVSCIESPEPKPFPPPEGYSSWEEYQEQYELQKEAQQQPEPKPVSLPKPELALASAPPVPSLEPQEIATEQDTPANEPEPELKVVKIKQPLSYEVVKSWVEEDKLININRISIEGIGESEKREEVPLYIACVTIKNTDTVSGDFMITFSIEEPLDNYFLKSTFELNPEETITVSCPAYTLGNWEYKITPSEKIISRLQE